jgi:uncharacterized protein (TIGR04562 family)
MVNLGLNHLEFVAYFAPTIFFPYNREPLASLGIKMDRPSYLEKYMFDWEIFDVLIGGKSALDARTYLGNVDSLPQIESFLNGYGFDLADPVLNAELFGNFQEAIQFIKRYFLKEGSPDGLDLSIPHVFYTITDVRQLMLISVHKSELTNRFEDSIWAAAILKVMHTILHVDKDLRSHYFSIIQQQIFDKFYKYLSRDSEDQLYFDDDINQERIYLADFQPKSKKSRNSIIIKLLQKPEAVAEELFDRIGVRIVTKSKVDVLKVLSFLHQNFVIVAHNIKPSRSFNSLLELDQFRAKHLDLVKMAIRNNLTEKRFVDAMERELSENRPNTDRRSVNRHTSSDYSAIHFTCRQLIKYKNPFMAEFKSVRKMSRELGKKAEVSEEVRDLITKIDKLDTSSINKDVRFFYPFEVQVTDEENHLKNTEGEASHNEYKRSQRISAMRRIFKTLAEYKGLEL